MDKFTESLLPPKWKKDKTKIQGKRDRGHKRNRGQMNITIAISPEEEAKIDEFFRNTYGYTLKGRIIRDALGLMNKARKQMIQREAVDAR